MRPAAHLVAALACGCGIANFFACSGYGGGGDARIVPVEAGEPVNTNARDGSPGDTPRAPLNDSSVPDTAPSVGDAAVDGPVVCASGPEHTAPYVNGHLTIQCPQGSVIQSIVFANYGMPTGSCGAYAPGSCGVDVRGALQTCVGLSSCTVTISNALAGDPCPDREKLMDVEATCRP